MCSKALDIKKAKQTLLEGVGAEVSLNFEIDDFQKEAIDHISSKTDTLVVAPTGAGKTFIALKAIETMLEQGFRSVYTTPLKALSNTKYADLKRTFEPKHSVGLLTGDRKIDGNAKIVVATTEIYRNELYKVSKGYGLVVLDEVHFISDAQRGPVWEESIILTPQDSTLLMLSASISNPQEVANWISDVRQKECKIVIKKERPVELRIGFLHPDLGVMPLSDERGFLFTPVQQFYQNFSLDSTGMRLRQNRDPRSDNRSRSSFRGRRPSNKRPRNKR